MITPAAAAASGLSVARRSLELFSQRWDEAPERLRSMVEND
jgi:hypothetical protein